MTFLIILKENIAEIAGMIEGTFSFDAAGSLSSQNNNMQGYFGTIVSNLAVRLQDNTERANFSDAILSDLYDRHDRASKRCDAQSSEPWFCRR